VYAAPSLPTENGEAENEEESKVATSPKSKANTDRKKGSSKAIKVDKEETGG